MDELYADLVVIGSGPAGQKSAIQAAKLGKSVMIIERYPNPGGASLHSGTIPSKSLREAILNLSDFYTKSFYGKREFKEHNISINDLNFCLNFVLDEQIKQLRRQFEKNKIVIIQGVAHFESQTQIAVLDEKNHLTHLVTGEKIVIAAGSKPRNPKNVPFDKEMVLDSTRLLSIDHVPETLLVLGGGIIGSEYASFFAALGTKVTVVDKKEQMLHYLDREIGLHLQTELTKIGLKFIANRELDEIIRHKDEVEVKFNDGSSLRTEMLLYALGRVANVDHLHIENAGISVDSKGYIPVNALFQTIVPNIYAVGDVIGGPSLASTSMEQGRLAARHAFGAETHHFPTFYPIGIYTIPEISSCGYTEEQLKNLGFRYEVGRAHYYEIAKNTIAGNDPGMFKILFHADTLEILGIHIIGRNATEVIHIGQVAMTFGARIDYFIDQVFNYPTYAEGYRIAALNGFNKVKHKR
ncbi:MAG: putative soluble pyridine nucleotide transhydrogenase [Chlamydiae bacterium]|nr:putative soluble pyridine nucleotide transhydrogenase [Chlamydiota bacterium]